MTCSGMSMSTKIPLSLIMLGHEEEHLLGKRK